MVSVWPKPCGETSGLAVIGAALRLGGPSERGEL